MENNAVHNVISFANVATRYDGGREILSDVSFNINSHSFYFLSGASGAGKTTLLRLIYQLHKPTRGQIKLFGKNTSGISRDEIADLRRKMSIVFQNYSLISNLSVFDNIALPLRVRGIAESYVRKLTGRALEWVGLSQYANTRPLALSGGQQQKVAVARAIITQPEVLLADEPTGNLDDDAATKLMDLFIQMNKSFGTTIIMATHSQKFLDNFNFPRILVADKKVTFQNAFGQTVEPLNVMPTGAPRAQGYFSELQNQFAELAGEKS
ncbi:MAG: ATP-binding cassette domain-containing protein [Rickettsiales bacterium]|jgi:cell division transport system ATP-binding protein|nr:ATP-binding cassette domain-containing protein [Rickettsiales bacterium]